MAQLSPKLRRFGPSDGWYGRGLSHWCPACESMHAFAIEQPFGNGARWTFDGNVEAPTFAPSMNIRVGPDPDNGSIEVCHYFLRAGRIEFLSDCTHAMRGQTVDLPDLPPWLRDP